ncbi:hypothetical protein FA95DRAFT_1556302, partial [Auriscalpium vulgare]
MLVPLVWTFIVIVMSSFFTLATLVGPTLVALTLCGFKIPLPNFARHSAAIHDKAGDILRPKVYRHSQRGSQSGAL